jgi:uncharacterized protein with ParB-like and HNH nuclease domain
MTQIQPNSQTLNELFKTYEDIKIPLNQRNFEWGRDQAFDFWNDVYESVDDNKKVFLGTIVLNNKEGSGKCTVVDGQQRLTTISIFLIALREREKEMGLEKAAQTLNETYLASANIMGETTKSKLSTSSSIADIYDLMSKIDWDGTFPDKLKNDKTSKQIKRQVKKIKPIYDYFKSKLDSFDTKEKIENLIRTFVNNLYFVVIKIADDFEALEIFERMNARGIALNAAELLKNHLFGHDDDFTEEEITASWDEIFKNSSEDMLRLIRYFYISKEGQVRTSELYKKLKDLIKSDGGAKNFVSNLKVFSEHYFHFANADRKELESYIIDKCGQLSEYSLDQICDTFEAIRLFKVYQVYPIICSAFNKTIVSDGSKDVAIKQFVRLITTLEKFHFINNSICKKPNNEIERFYADKCRELSPYAEISNTFVDSMISGLSERLEKFETFKDNFSEIYYDQGEQSFRTIYYIFDRINNFGRVGAQRINIYNTDTRLIRKNYNIDHINPKKGELYDYNQSETKEYINNIGNLIVIPYQSNSQAQNIPVREKVEEIYKKYDMQLPAVVDFVTKFKESDWSSRESIFDSIDKRTADLAEQAFRRVWKMN